MRALLTASLVLLLLACERKQRHAPVTDAAPPAPPSAPVVTLPASSADAAAPPALPPFTLGPAASNAAASREQREHAVLELLAGGEAALGLPEHDLDPGKSFQPNLRERLAPRAPVPTGKVRHEAPEVVGKLAAEVVTRTVRQNFGRLRLCYDRALAEDPGLSGELTTKFVIQRDGSVKVQGVDSPTLRSPSLRGCVLSAFSQLRFPEPEAGTVSVTFPLKFSPDK